MCACARVYVCVRTDTDVYTTAVANISATSRYCKVVDRFSLFLHERSSPVWCLYARSYVWGRRSRRLRGAPHCIIRGMWDDVKPIPHPLGRLDNLEAEVSRLSADLGRGELQRPRNGRAEKRKSWLP